MNIKKALCLFSAAAGLAATLSAITASAGSCGFSIPISSGAGSLCSNSLSSGRVRATVSSGANSDSWTYQVNYLSGPVNTQARAILIGGSNEIVADIISKKFCVAATDVADFLQTFGSAQVCVTKPAGQSGAPRTVRISIP